MALFDRELRYLAANRLWCRLLGLPETDPVGRLHRELAGPQADRWQAVFERTLAGERQAFVEIAPESGIPHQWVMAPLRGSGGTVIGVGAYCHLLAPEPGPEPTGSDPVATAPSPPASEVGSVSDLTGVEEPTPEQPLPPMPGTAWLEAACPALVVDREGRIARLNQAAQALRLPGRTSAGDADTTGAWFWEVYAGRAAAERMREALLLVLGGQTEQPVALPAIELQPDDEAGAPARLLWSAMTLSDADGSVSGGYLQAVVDYPGEQAAMLVRERGQRRQLEQRLAAAEEELAAMQRSLEALPSPVVLAGFEWLNALPVAALVLEGDVVRQWNQACSALLAWPGMKGTEAGPRDLDAPPTINELIQQRANDDRHRAQLLKQWRHLAEQGGGGALSMKHPRTGNQELWFEVSHVDLPVVGDLRAHEPDATDEHRLVLIRDITEDRQQQVALRASENRLRSVVRQLRLPLLVTDTEGRVFDCNPAFEKLCDRSRAELLRMEWSDLLSPEHWQRCQSVIRDLDERGASYGSNVLRLLDEGSADGSEVGVDVILVRDQWDQLQHLAYLFGGGLSDSSQTTAAALDRQNNNRQIRNGLHIIHTLLDLQWHSTSVGAAREALKASQNRVQAILEVFQDGTMDPDGTVSVTGLAGALAHRLAAEAGWTRDSHQIKVEGDDHRLPVETMVPVALIVSELVSLAISRARPPAEDPEKRGCLALTWNRLEGGSKLGLHFDTVLEDKETSPVGSARLGLRIVETLAEQLGGGLSSDPGPPLRLEVDLPHIGGTQPAG